MATNGRADRKYCAILLFMLSTSCALAQSAPGTDSPSTAELKRLVAADPAFKRLLIASIERAKQVNPDPVTNPAQSLEQYYEFISWAERALPGDLAKVKPDATLYQRLDQSLGYLYYICDQPRDELQGRGLFNNSLQYVERRRSGPLPRPRTIQCSRRRSIPFRKACGASTNSRA